MGTQLYSNIGELINDFCEPIVFYGSWEIDKNNTKLTHESEWMTYNGIKKDWSPTKSAQITIELSNTQLLFKNWGKEENDSIIYDNEPPFYYADWEFIKK